MKNSIFLLVLFSLTSLVNLNATAHTYSDGLFKTIILINGAPFLVELDQNGKVIHNYIMVQEYFESNESHEDLVIKASNEFEEEVAALKNSRLLIFNENSSLLNDIAVDHIRDLATLYSKGILQNINITAGYLVDESENNSASSRISAISNLLKDFGVKEGDISADMKIYKSVLPNQFVKIDLLR